jgi:hypothetical protein
MQYKYYMLKIIKYFITITQNIFYFIRDKMSWMAAGDASQRNQLERHLH